MINKILIRLYTTVAIKVVGTPEFSDLAGCPFGNIVVCFLKFLRMCSFYIGSDVL